MTTIKKLTAREILNSKGSPTIEVQLFTSDGNISIASVPSGESVGKFEGKELRDKDNKRYQGRGVQIPVHYINNLIGPKLENANIDDPRNIDYWLIKADGTTDYSKLGVNTITAISMAVHKAIAYSNKVPLYKYIEYLYKNTHDPKHQINRIPTPIFNIINGGKHGNNNLDFQEFQVIPSTAIEYPTSLELGVELYGRLKHLLIYRGANVSVSDEGGFTPNLVSNTDALDLIKEVIMQTSYRLGIDIYTGIDFAANSYFKSGRYQIIDKTSPLKSDDYIEFIHNLSKAYNMLILEDVLDEADQTSWQKSIEKYQGEAYIAGDDFIGGSKERLEKAIKDKEISALVIKLNQNATISELIDLTATAKKSNLKVIISHRLGETNDDLIADLSVGLQSEFIKFGAIARGERVAKYNRLLEIYSEISKK